MLYVEENIGCNSRSAHFQKKKEKKDYRILKQGRRSSPKMEAPRVKYAPRKLMHYFVLSLDSPTFSNPTGIRATTVWTWIKIDVDVTE